MSREQRTILVVFLILLSSGCFGAASYGWASIFVGVCLGTAFNLFGSEDDEAEGPGPDAREDEGR